MLHKNHLSCLKQLSRHSQQVAYWQQASSGRRGTFSPDLPLFRLSCLFLKCYEPLRKLFSPFHPARCLFSKPPPSFYANGPSLNITSEQVCPRTQAKAHSNAVSVFSVYELYVSLHFWDNLQDNQRICNALSRKGLLGMNVIKNVITFLKKWLFLYDTFQ